MVFFGGHFDPTVEKMGGGQSGNLETKVACVSVVAVDAALGVRSK